MTIQIKKLKPRCQVLLSTFIPRYPEILESITTKGLFPCGEGPSYAGGITSAAVDGIKAALAWIEKYVL